MIYLLSHNLERMLCCVEGGSGALLPEPFTWFDLWCKSVSDASRFISLWKKEVSFINACLNMPINDYC